ncbi:MAG TPA: hypothetical protein VGE53_02390 [Candidatus Paceibacterota bacterium]
MDYADLKAIEPIVTIGTTRYKEEIESFLRKALASEGEAFPHYTIVRGGPGSMRLHLQTPYADSIDLPAKYPDQLAEAYVGFIENEARYPDQPHPDRVRGIAVRTASINGKRAALVEAVWI